ncbi:hypothetical protein [Bordetella genomosp. 4]|uniref:DUF4175 domain-containing protein n=1 Tax=Bordetella genomosp. 4 TaxID=463044 RepID=A0A261U4Q2_9BORD|nr:hypothetical protein [Bordetella genomosp. 4]OZI56467.1 hypothetical protein CAL20_13635 [Bordetella genomosp. 4]
MSSRSRFLFVWGAPIVLGLLSVFGLLAALLGTGLWHWASWLSLAILLVVIVKYWWFPAKPADSTAKR